MKNVCAFKKITRPISDSPHIQRRYLLYRGWRMQSIRLYSSKVSIQSQWSFLIPW